MDPNVYTAQSLWTRYKNCVVVQLSVVDKSKKDNKIQDKEKQMICNQQCKLLSYIKEYFILKIFWIY